MILVDTSVWINHFRKKDDHLVALLENGNAVSHPFILGELASGQLKNRSTTLSLLQSIPRVQKVDEDELLFFIEKQKLMGLGIGYVDIHLLASCLVSKTQLWTQDRNLHRVLFSRFGENSYSP